MIRPTYAEVNLDNVEFNMKQVRSIVPADIHIMAIVKADAYGHGSVQVAKRALKSGADFLGVAIPEEGIVLRKAGIDCPILVLGGVLPDSISDVINNQLHQAVFDKETILALEKECKSLKKNAFVHLSINTGMNRIGVNDIDSLKDILTLLKKCEYVKLMGMFTHFATADEQDKKFTYIQNKKFYQAVQTSRDMGFEIPYVHAANTAAILDCHDLYYSMVRFGIGLYGYYPSDFVSKSIKLKPVLSWKTKVVCIKTISKGESVSYGRIFTADSDRVIATLPVGYDDGYKRNLGNKGYVIVKGKKAPIVGRVCMDQCMIDITDIPDVKKGDTVVLLGEQDGKKITADDMAGWCGTISYEILTSIGKRVPRFYISNEDR